MDPGYLSTTTSSATACRPAEAWLTSGSTSPSSHCRADGRASVPMPWSAGARACTTSIPSLSLHIAELKGEALGCASARECHPRINMAPPMDAVLAYIPEYTAAVSGAVLGAAIAIPAIPALITGRSSLGYGSSPAKTRVLACLAVAVGMCLALIVFALAPHQGGVTDPRDRWGLSTTKSKVIVGTWIFILATATVWDLVRELRSLRGDSRAGRRGGPSSDSPAS